MKKEKQHIPAGYKLSPLGIIPKDWEVKKLGEIGDFSKGNGVPKDKIIKDEHGHPCLTYGDLYTKYDFVIKDIKSFIDDVVASESKEIHIGDICFAGSGETPEDIGKCATYIEEKTAFAGGDIIILSPNKGINSIWLSYVLNSDIGGKQRYKSAQGFSIVHIYPDNLKRILIPTPTLKEQQRIVSVLQLWDTAISKQTQLVEKLTLRKRGLMQQLLTGKKRLKGFSGEWKEVRLGEIGIAYGGLVNKNKEDFENGNALFITYMNVFSNGKIDINNLGQVRILPSEKQEQVQYGDIFFTVSSETPDEVGMASVLLNEVQNTYLNSFCFGYRLNDFKFIVPVYASYLFRGDDFRKEMFKIAQGSTRFNISKTEVLSMRITIPSIEEQNTIASVLVEADKEIELANKKLARLQEEKKGLMQVLLTGKKRIK